MRFVLRTNDFRITTFVKHDREIQNMLKIAIGSISVLIFSFSVLIVISFFAKSDNIDMVESEFLLSDFSSNRTIFLIGSSHVKYFNVVKINDIISEEFISVYNLARDGNTPIKRLDELDQIISVNPEIIFYGISYRDFGYFNENKDTLSLYPITSKTLNSFFEDWLISNPKMISIQFIKDLIKPISSDKITYSEKRTPYVTYSSDNDKIMTNDELNSTFHPQLQSDNSYDEVLAFNEIVDKLQNNDIKLILFTTPLSEIYLKSITDEQKNAFSKLKENLKKKFGIKIYEFENKYSKLEIWQGGSHISYNSSITIVNEDIAEMIKLEIEK